MHIASRHALWGLALLLGASLLGGCDQLIGPIPEDEEIVPPPRTPPADALEAALRERGRECAPYMVLEEDAMRGEGEAGDARDFSRMMHPGWCYKVVGLGEESIEDLDIRVYDPNSILLERDTTQDRQPYLGQMRPICPPESGAYRIEVRVVAGEGPFAVQLYRSL